MNNNKGYILIFFSFFATVLGLSANFFLIKTDMRANYHRAARLGEVVEQHGDRVKVLLSSYQQCTENLKGQTVGADLQIPTESSPAKVSPSLDRTDGKKILAPGQIIETPIGPIEIRSIRVAEIDNSLGVTQDHLIIAADLNPEGRKNSKILNFKAIKIPLKTRKVGNVIQECYYDESNFIEDRIRSNCEQVGRFISIWDDCDIPNNFISEDEVNCGFSLVRIEKVDGTYQIVCGEGV